MQSEQNLKISRRTIFLFVRKISKAAILFLSFVNFYHTWLAFWTLSLNPILKELGSFVRPIVLHKKQSNVVTKQNTISQYLPSGEYNRTCLVPISGLSLSQLKKNLKWSSLLLSSISIIRLLIYYLQNYLLKHSSRHHLPQFKAWFWNCARDNAIYTT